MKQDLLILPGHLNSPFLLGCFVSCICDLSVSHSFKQKLFVSIFHCVCSILKQFSLVVTIWNFRLTQKPLKLVRDRPTIILVRFDL